MSIVLDELGASDSHTGKRVVPKSCLLPACGTGSAIHATTANQHFCSPTQLLAPPPPQSALPTDRTTGPRPRCSKIEHFLPGDPALERRHEPAEFEGQCGGFSPVGEISASSCGLLPGLGDIS